MPISVTDDVFESYMDAPEGGTYDAYYVARDVYRLIGYIEGMKDAFAMMHKEKPDA